jgi:hypothetical protein
MIHFYPLNPRMCQLGVRNVGSKRRRAIEAYLQEEVKVKLPILPYSEVPPVEGMFKSSKPLRYK